MINTRAPDGANNVCQNINSCDIDHEWRQWWVLCMLQGLPLKGLPRDPCEWYHVGVTWLSATGTHLNALQMVMIVMVAIRGLRPKRFSCSSTYWECWWWSIGWQCNRSLMQARGSKQMVSRIALIVWFEGSIPNVTLPLWLNGDRIGRGAIV